MQIVECALQVSCLAHWQELAGGVLAFAAGLLGFAAAIFAVLATLGSEKRREDRATSALKRALIAEIMQFASHALEGFEVFRKRAAVLEGISLHELETATRFPKPVVYPNNAGGIGNLGDRANDVVLFYNRVDILVGTLALIVQTEKETFVAGWEAMASMSGRPFDGLNARANVRSVTIGKENTARIAEALLQIMEAAAEVVPEWAAGTIDEPSTRGFAAQVAVSRTEWSKLNTVEKKKEGGSADVSQPHL